jgi:Domain of unknown function (DUF4388)
MSAPSCLEGVAGLRDWLVADHTGRPVTSPAEGKGREVWAATSAAASHQLADASAELGLGAVRLVTVKGPRALSVTASCEHSLLLASLDPAKPSAGVEQALIDWSHSQDLAGGGDAPAPAREETADEATADELTDQEVSVEEDMTFDEVAAGDAAVDEAAGAGMPVSRVPTAAVMITPLPSEDESVLLTPLDLSPSDSWANLRGALARGLLAEAASRWRQMAGLWPQSAGASTAPVEEHERAMQTLLEGIGTVLAGDGVGGGLHLRAVATLARDQPSLQWLARLWGARAALKSGSLVTALGHAQSALRLATDLDDQARAVSRLCAAEVRAADGQDPAGLLAALDEVVDGFVRLGDAWGASRALMAKARVQASLGLDAESAGSARSARAADQAWDQPALFQARRALENGKINEAEHLLAAVRSPDAARDLSVIASIRLGALSLEQACEFLRQRDAPPTVDSLAAIQRLARACPGFLQAQEALGWLLLKQGKYSDAQTVLQALLEEPLAAGDRASVLLGLGCIANAVELTKPESRLRAAVSASRARPLEALPEPPPVLAADPAPAPRPVRAPQLRQSVSSPGAVFSGQLGAFPLPDLLEFLRNGRRTGLLVCGSTAGIGALRFSEGSITCGAAPGVPPLGELLHAAGHLDAATLEKIAGRPAEAGSPLLGEVLVREGKVSVEAVRAAASEQIRAALRVLVKWADGQFAFDREQPGEIGAAATAVSLDPQALLLDLFREQDESARDQAEAAP